MSAHPGETTPGIPGATRYLCPLCDWWLDVPPPPFPTMGGPWLDPMGVYASELASIEGALAGHFATARHRAMGYGFGPWTAETIRLCRCGHPRGDHLRHAQSCLYSTDAETWACDCAEFTPR